MHGEVLRLERTHFMLSGYMRLMLAVKSMGELKQGFMLAVKSMGELMEWFMLAVKSMGEPREGPCWLFSQWGREGGHCNLVLLVAP